MIDQRIIDFLEENGEFKLLPDYQQRFRQVLLDNGVNPASALVDLMATYSGEFNGSEGSIINVADDLSDYEASVTKQLVEEEGVDAKYISLFNFEFDDYLLYNKENDSVVLIEGGNVDNLRAGNFSKEWKSFNEFLIAFFEL